MSEVFIDARFWSEAQCARVRASIDRAMLSPAEIYAGDFVVDERVRRSFEADVDEPTVREVEEAMAQARPRISRFFGTLLAGAEGPGFLRYLPGGFYAAHRDSLGDQHDAFPRRIAVVVFLSGAGAPLPGGCEGGALRLYGAAADASAVPLLDIAPQTGTLIAFPATWLHEVLPVTAGIRDAIVDWFY